MSRIVCYSSCSYKYDDSIHPVRMKSYFITKYKTDLIYYFNQIFSNQVQKILFTLVITPQ